MHSTLLLDGSDAGGGHALQLYDHPAFLVDLLTRFVATGLAVGEAVLIIATEEHLQALDRAFEERGMDFSAARSKGQYVSLEAAATLRLFMVDGLPDRERFTDVVGGVVKSLVANGSKVRAFGEMVAILLAAGSPRAVISLEQLWNELATTLPFSLLCAYPLSAFPNADDLETLQRVGHQHAQVLPTETYVALGVDARLRTIAELEQQARALRPEVIRRRDLEHRFEQYDRMLRAVVEMLPLPVVVTDPDTTVRLWNPAAEKLFGWAATEVVGKPIPIVPSHKSDECQHLRTALAGGERLTGFTTQRSRRDVKLSRFGGRLRTGEPVVVSTRCNPSSGF